MTPADSPAEPDVGGAPDSDAAAAEVLRRAEAAHAAPSRLDAVGRVVGEVLTARACLLAGAPLLAAHLAGARPLSPPTWWFALWAVLVGGAGSPTWPMASPEVRAEAGRRLTATRVADVVGRAAVLAAVVLVYDAGGLGPPPEVGGLWVATKSLFVLAAFVAALSTPYADPGLGADLHTHAAHRSRRVAAGILLFVGAVAFSYRRPLVRLFTGRDLGPTSTSPDPDPAPVSVPVSGPASVPASVPGAPPGAPAAPDGAIPQGSR